MIMLADHLVDAMPGQQTLQGINMTVRRNAFGRQVDSFERDIPLTGIAGPPDRPFRAVFIRAPWVERVGPQVEVLGTDPATGRIVAVQQGPLLATAFHPELTGDARVHRRFADLVKAVLSRRDARRSLDALAAAPGSHRAPAPVGGSAPHDPRTEERT
jgi:5'-phosphate synthase pdxT subunit